MQEIQDKISVQLQSNRVIDDELTLCIFYNKGSPIKPKYNKKDWYELIKGYFLDETWSSPKDYKVEISISEKLDNCATIKITYPKDEDEKYKAEN